MGIIQCKKHGQQFFHHTCKHIYENFKNGQYPNMLLFPVLEMKICNSCYNKLELSKLNVKTIDEIIEKPEKEANQLEKIIEDKYNQFDNRACICIECMKELQLRHIRNLGKADPFKPYENTLMHIDQHIIEKLKHHLFKNHDFQYSIIPYLKDVKACFIKSGGISYPLSIDIYYVTETKNQNKIINLIDDFFISIAKKQRVIRFYEKEVWVKKGNVEKKGKEKLLLKITV